MKVLLRNVVQSDLATLFRHQADPVASRMAAFTPRDRNDFTAHWTKILDDPTVAKKAIVVDGQVVGNIVSFERSGKRQVGYWIDREFWGRGIATQALSQFLLLETVRPLHAMVAKRNPASVRVLEKCGFALAGEGRGCPDSRGPVVEEFEMRLGSDEVENTR